MRDTGNNVEVRSKVPVVDPDSGIPVHNRNIEQNRNPGGIYEEPAELKELRRMINSVPTFGKNEDISTRILKTPRITEGTSESFWGVDSETGKSFYLKTEADENKLNAEILADSIYRQAGIKIPNKQLVIYGGKIWIASEEIPEAKPCYLGTLEQYQEQIKQGFVVDALLANHDVFGLVTNANIMESDGQLYRIDSGGTFTYRGRHGEKPYSRIACPDIDSMRNPDFTTGKIYSGVTDEQIALQVGSLIQKLTPEKIRTLIEESGINNPQDIEKALIGRLAYLNERFVMGEGEKQLEFLASVESFPEALKAEAQIAIDTLMHGRSAIESFLVDHRSDFDELTKLEDSIPQPGEWVNVSPRKLKVLELVQGLNVIGPSPQEVNYPEDISCKELAQAKAAYYQALNQVNQLLGRRETVINEKEEIEYIKRNIEAESIKTNQELSSHVTGFEDLIKILQSGKLMSKAKQQTETGAFQAKISSKSTSEMHQIVFDRRSFRPEYSSPEGSPKVPPVIFMIPSSHLLSNYQGMDSDGWHAFGKEHNEVSGTIDDFSIEVGNPNLVIMVPEEYRDALRSQLVSMISQEEGMDEAEKRMNIVYMPKECYRESETGRLLCSGDFTRDSRPLQKVYEIAEKILPEPKLVRGRILRNGNLGHGSASWNKPLFQYIQAVS